MSIHDFFKVKKIENNGEDKFIVVSLDEKPYDDEEFHSEEEAEYHIYDLFL